MPLGTKVKIGDDIPATITGVMFRINDAVSYEVTWWENRAHKTEWLYPSEVTTDGPVETVRMGFGATA